jgi:hypothetical protein
LSSATTANVVSQLVGCAFAFAAVEATLTV